MSDTVVAAPWGEGVLAWFDALEAAAENGVEHVEPFLAADLRWETTFGPMFIDGVADLFNDIEGDVDELFLGPAQFFVSADDVLREKTFFLDTPWPASYLNRMTVGPDGIRHIVNSGSIGIDRMYWQDGVDFDRYESAAERYVAFWNGTEDVDVASVYHSDATVSDTLLGEELSGREAIGRSVVSGEWPAIGHMSTLDVPNGGGPAVHLALTESGVWLLLEVDDGSGCPGVMGVTLELDGDVVRREHRFHDIDSVRQCYEPTELEPGWWEGLEIPATVHRERTGTITYRGTTIDIMNGTPALETFVEWGLSRFEDAGLAVPQVASTSFIQARKACYNRGGTWHLSEQGSVITLCRTEDDICDDEACQTWRARDRQTLLHELAHAWTYEHTDEAVQAEYLQMIEVPRWLDLSDPWEERGFEWAADAIAYALMDDPVESAPELATTCDERMTGFRILTGVEPLTGCEP